MKRKGNIAAIIALVFLFLNANAASRNTSCGHCSSYMRPVQMYGCLFHDIMECDSLFGPDKLFIESKSVVDMIPKRDVNMILADYCRLGDGSLEQFIKGNFTLPSSKEKVFTEKTNIDAYIKALWKFLSCPKDSDEFGTRILMHHPYFVPGGRFREMYYWDSYFSMLGMLVDDEHDLVISMLDNFSDCIHRLGFIPNGMRTYYLGRSQPPFFSFMVSDAASRYTNDDLIVKYLDALVAEYNFWMNGKERLSEANSASLRTVRMPDGEILNRYYDNFDDPREEAWRNDIETASQSLSVRPNADVKLLYRNLRAGAESGMDFSSRWMEDGKNLYTIRTTDIVPVDLNCLLYHLERTLAKGYILKGDKKMAKTYTEAAENRGKAINKYLWSDKDNFFMDYILSENRLSEALTLAGVYPLFCNVATSRQAKKVESTLRAKFLKAGGVVTTLKHTGQQWDAPNGWAPLQWVTYKGLRNYKCDATASTLQQRWLETCRKVFAKTGKMLEKYNVEIQDVTGGGEYSNQTGFGWTNGVYRAMEIEE